MTDLQRLAGNTAVARLFASVDLQVQRAPGDAEPSSTDGGLEPWIVDIQADLGALGVAQKEMGAPASFRDLGEAEAHRLVALLERYKSDPGLVFTSSSKIVRSWNARRDDLGVGGRAGYRTILHYVGEMERLANNSLGGRWPDNLKVMSQAIRVGGARFHVHPRMLYFAAAAQVGMNEAATMASDEGHYLAPAAVFEELRMIRNAAVLVDDLAADVERAHAATGSTDPAPGVEGAAAVYANLASRLKHVADIRASQAAGSGLLDHPEPLAAHMDDTMASEIERLPAAANDDADAVARCREIMVMTWHKPAKRQAHGWGAGDPHGTHHALGMAMDAFYGTAKGDYANSFKFLRGSTAEGIAALLVGEYGAEYDLHPLPPEQLARHIRTDPEAGRAFAVMLRDHASDAQLRFEAATLEDKDPETNRLVAAFKDLRRAILKGLRSRHAVAKQVLARRKLMRDVATLKPYVAEIVAEQSPAKVSRNRHPSKFLAASKVATGCYEGLRITLEQASLGITEPELDPTAAPDLATPLGDLERDLDGLERAVDVKEVAALRRRMPAGFRRALDRAASGGLALDQPLEVLRGFASVQGARLQSGHHFQVTAWKSVLESKKTYTSKVVADMTSRTPGGVRDILQVMAQTRAGYEAVFGEETGPASIVPALREWAKTSKADVDAMLEVVHELLPPPSLAGLEPRRKQLASDLYSRGFYDAALAVASPGETP